MKRQSVVDARCVFRTSLALLASLAWLLTACGEGPAESTSNDVMLELQVEAQAEHRAMTPPDNSITPCQKRCMQFCEPLSGDDLWETCIDICLDVEEC